MSYLERNQQTLAEIGQNLRLRRGSVIGRSPNTTFTSIGNYKSTILEKDLYIGLKENRHKEGDFLRGWVARELVLINMIEQRFPQLLPEFPVFHGILEHPTGETLGVLTEDFSYGGRYPVKGFPRSLFVDIPDKDVPKELEEIAGKEIDNYDLATMCFLVNGQRRIGDFGEMYSGMITTELSERYPIDDLMATIVKYTLRIDYPL